MKSIENGKKTFSENLENIRIHPGLPKANKDKKFKELTKDLVYPKSLFKFRSAENNKAIDAFENDILYFSVPSNFNDPFDNSYYINKELGKRLLDIVYSKDNLFKLATEVVGIDDKIIKYTGESKNDFIEFIENYENIKPFLPEINKCAKQNLENIISESLMLLQDLIWVCSLSESINNTLLWSHYADSHKGFAIEYEIKLNMRRKDNSTLLPVIYKSSRCDASSLFEKVKKIKDFTSKKAININDTLDLIRIILQKSKDWKYEKEWRMISARKLNESKDNKRFLSLPPKAIYLGCKIEDNKKDMLVEIAKEKMIPVFQMFIDFSKNKYKLSFREIGGINNIN